jgi:Flp pilus assembly pilin Flp
VIDFPVGIDAAMCIGLTLSPRWAEQAKNHEKPLGENIMKNFISRLIQEDDGMEMVEWAIVGVVFAVAAAVFWGDLADAIDLALDDIEAEVTPGA